MSFISDETKKLKLVRKQLKEWSNNIPIDIQNIQKQRRYIENKIERWGRWDDKLINEYGRMIKHTCCICGYSFGDESPNYDEGYMKEIILDMVTQQKEAHVEVCRSGIFSH